MDELPVEPLARHLLHVEFWMRQGETEQLASGVPGGANY